jgi:hypothetical protein
MKYRLVHGPFAVSTETGTHELKRHFPSATISPLLLVFLDALVPVLLIFWAE